MCLIKSKIRVNVSTSKARFYYETKLRAHISQSRLADDTADTPLKNTHTHTVQMDGVGGREGGPLARCMQSQI